MKTRYIVSGDSPSRTVPIEQIEAGFPFEVIDSTHYSDGGPVMVKKCRTLEEAQRFAKWFEATKNEPRGL